MKKLVRTIQGRQQIYVRLPDGSYQLESRYVGNQLALKELGRELTDDEIVLHVDGNSTNNDPSNLVIRPRRGFRYPDKNVELECEQCGKLFFRNRGRVKEGAQTFCSQECYQEYRSNNRD